MRKRYFTALLALLLVLLCCGCSNASQNPEDAPATTEATVPATVPEDGDPNNVTCKGSYTTDAVDGKAVVAKVADRELTAEQLQVWYWLAVCEYARGDHAEAPDFSRPLDTQSCPVDNSVNSWQQYFLKQALNTWHSACALELQAQSLPLPTEEAYQPNLDNYEKYMTGMPATEFLYGYNPLYEPNTLHEAYLNALPETLEELAKQKGYSSLKDMASAAFGVSADVLTEAVRLYNFSYAYFTTLSYYQDNSDEQVQAYKDSVGGYDQTDYTVDIRHILLVPKEPEKPVLPAWKIAATEPTEPVETEPPIIVEEDGTVQCSEYYWDLCMEEAELLIKSWKSDVRCSEFTFSNIANKRSADTGSALNGGIYKNIRPGQLMKEMDAWCFDPARKSGETAIFRSPYGCHILYFTGATTAGQAQAREDLAALNLQKLIEEARAAYPAKVNYSAMQLGKAEAAVSASDVLYPDIAHERFPEIPLYLQQDYGSTRYGAFPLRTNGCGITTMAMIASYFADDELTPPEMCARYGHYSHSNGTDGMIFQYEPAVMGFYLRQVSYDHRDAKAALEEGQVVVSVQHKGYWTSGGHYIALEKLLEDGKIQVRDSNIFNYRKLLAHQEDRHTWGSIIADGSGFWIFEDKITRIPACSRCGTEEGRHASRLEGEYICEKCTPALLRRNTYLNACSLGA